MSGTVTLVSAGANGQGSLPSLSPSISADGTKVAFESRASNLVVGDTNGALDVYVKDLVTGEVTFASAGENGAGSPPRDNRSTAAYSASLSANGTKVAFTAVATNLVAGDTNGVADVFVKDLATGAITLASAGANGRAAGGAVPSLSADGTKVAFESGASDLAAGDTNGVADVFVRDLATGAITLASAGANGRAAGGAVPSLSADGTKVAFVSGASDLVAGDTNGVADVFVKDLATGAITLASAGANGPGNGASSSFSQPSISADGTRVAFSSSASDLVANDTNGVADVFVKDLATGAITLVSAGANGQGNDNSYNVSISADGGKVAFDSLASNLVADDGNGWVDVFVKDLPGVGQIPPGGSVTIGAGPDALVLRVTQDAYQGSAQYAVAVDGVQIGGTLTASALHGSGQSDTVTVRGDWAAGGHTAAITFLNDAWGGTADTDRNLYLDGATYDGAAVPGAVAALYASGSAGFGFTDAAPPPSGGAVTIGSGPDALVLMLQQDAYQGDAQYTVAVDGMRIEGALTASATRASGLSDTVTVRGDWALGEHTASVTFLNDAWGGTADTDRNLYVTGASYNGAVVPGAQAVLYASGSANFGFADTMG